MKYTHKPSSRARNLTITIKDTGVIIVTTPKKFSQKKIDFFLKEKQTWIEKTLAKVKFKQIKLHNKDEVILFGKIYKRKLELNPKKPIGIYVLGQSLVINSISLSIDVKKTKKPIFSTANKKRLNRFFKNTAEKYIIPRTHQIAKKMNVSFNKITLREQKSRWGSCSTKGNLNFNWRLVHYSPNIIDYVIVHELAHITHPNHSKQFWNFVAQYDSQYLKHRGWLKRTGMILK